MAMKKEEQSLFDFEASEEEEVFENFGEYEKMKLSELDSGATFDGRPILNYFQNDDRKYDSIRLRIVDDDTEELVDAYVNIPKPDANGMVRNINESFGFYHNLFNLIRDTISLKDGRDMSRIHAFKRMNIEQIMKVYEDAEHVEIEVIDGLPDDDYNSFNVTKIE